MSKRSMKKRISVLADRVSLASRFGVDDLR